MNNFDFKLAVSDPNLFFGRTKILKEICDRPSNVWIILGGRRIGKTSFLNALEFGLIDPTIGSFEQPFPVVIDLNRPKPKSLDNLRYILISRAWEAVSRWKEIDKERPTLRSIYKNYLRQIISGEVSVSFLEQIKVKLLISNPDYERALDDNAFTIALEAIINEIRKTGEYNGICFLLDSAEFITSQDWALDAWTYFRALKDSDKAYIKQHLGLVLSGYRELRDYQQKVCSPLLNIANIRWLYTLTDDEVKALVKSRIENLNSKLETNFVVQPDLMDRIIQATGCHPCLIQLFLNKIELKLCNSEELVYNDLFLDFVEEYSNLFSSWWNESQEAGRLGDQERLIYKALCGSGNSSLRSLSERTNLRMSKLKKSLDVLLATGIVREPRKKEYVVGSSLFEHWVRPG